MFERPENRNYDIAKNTFPAEAVDFIRNALTSYKVDRKIVLQTMLISEELMVLMAKHMPENESLSVGIKRVMGEPVVSFRAKGQEFDINEIVSKSAITSEDMDNEVAEGVIRSIIINSYGNKLKYRNKGGVNMVSISTGVGGKKGLYYTIGALFLALILGFLFRVAAPEAVNDVLCNVICLPLRTMFINALKVIVAPVVFLSIVTCISQFTNLAELGRIGAKVVGSYIFTTVFAVCMAIGIFNVLKPGHFGMAVTGGGAASGAAGIAETPSILQTIINIVPSNFIQPFLEADTMQLLFLAILCGVAVGMIGDYSKILRDIFEALNSLFLTITELIARLIPVAVFCSIFLMVVQTGSSSVIAMLQFAGTELLSIACMLIFYALLILVAGRLDPVRFYKKIKNGMVTAFTLASSSAAIPTNISICEKTLGISRKVSSFSIPLGSTINMDGTSIHLALATLFLARAYGVNVPSSALFSLVVTILLLSISSPGVPGATLVCVGVLLAYFGVPTEAVGLIIGVDSLLDMIRTMSNVTGDMVVSLVVAKSEKLLDLAKFNS